MLLIGHFYPRHRAWKFTRKPEVELKPWRYALPSAFILFAMIISLYLIFSEIGFVNGLSSYLLPSLIAVWSVTFVLCFISDRNWKQKYEASLAQIGLV